MEQSAPDRLAHAQAALGSIDEISSCWCFVGRVATCLSCANAQRERAAVARRTTPFVLQAAGARRALRRPCDDAVRLMWVCSGGLQQFSSGPATTYGVGPDRPGEPHRQLARRERFRC